MPVHAKQKVFPKNTILTFIFVENAFIVKQADKKINNYP